MAKLLALLSLSRLACVVDAQEALYYVDVASPLCTSGTAGMSQVRVDVPTDMAQRSNVYVPVFFRAGGYPMTMSYQLDDSRGQSIVPRSTIALAPQRGRLLSGIGIGPITPDGHHRVAKANESTPDEGLCEDVFLAYGASPVDLPDMWSDAREAFRGICEQEGAVDCAADETTLFKGTPEGEDAFKPSSGFCEGLARYAARSSGGAASFARRLKGGGGSYTGSGGTKAVGGWESASRSSMGPYGYTSSRMSTTYPGGYAQTSYGYSARGASFPRAGTTAVVVAVAAGGLTGYGAMRWSQRVGSQSECSGSTCGWDLRGEELVRDDIMTHGFKPSEMTYPLILSIWDVRIGDFNMSKVCSEGEANMSAYHDMDLFFSIAPVDALEEDEDDWGVLGLLPGLLFLGCLCYCCFWRPSMKRYKRMKHMRKMREDGESVINATETIGGGSCFKLEGEDMRQGELALNIDANGIITGRSTSGNVSGKVIRQEPHMLALVWTLQDADCSFEADAILMRSTGSVPTLTLQGEWFSCSASACCPQLHTKRGTLFFVGDAPGTNPVTGSPVVVGQVVMGQPIGVTSLCDE
eukprot:CAMPEP_0176024604 /NCGR_PEP_ID=MMETSP0120_2-20121206/12025_1 /TAXON_ID=160619 /ORGANISM="Kryptoperidinium foliaceum, Strain CCMP 1326" /LENGTH=579 /DNA_ID=CAMNT_0017357783 /DNA_START=30 /DNA_END=1769 /DNA_ORIENTATION=+